MDGIHDMGGMHGFGAGPRGEHEEAVFHQPWDGRILPIAFGVGSIAPGANVDAGRHAIERIDPAAYLAASYYARWLRSVESLITDAGVCSDEDIDLRVAALRTKAADV